MESVNRDKISSTAGWAPVIVLGLSPFSALFSAFMFDSPRSEPTPLALFSAHMFLWSFLWGFALVGVYVWFRLAQWRERMWVIWVGAVSYYVLAYSIFIVARFVIS